MNAFHRGACAAAVVLTLACANTARAQTTFYTSNSTITSPIVGNVVVGYDSTFTAKSSPSVILDTRGSISHDVQVFNNSTFYMNSDVGGSLSAYDNATVTVAGGTLSYALFADNFSTVNINEGTLSNVVDAFNNSTVNVRGGNFQTLVGFDNSVINIYGSVTATLTNPAFGYQGAYSQYTLAGSTSTSTLGPNTFLNIVNNSGATFHLLRGPSVADITPVPEPGSVALLLGLSVAGAGFAAKRRRQRA